MATSLVLHLFLLLASSAARVRPCSAAKPTGFTLKLIHRDSPSSPLYNPTSTPAQRNEQAILRSRERSKQLKSAFANSKIFSRVGVGSGDYLLEMAIGTPARAYWLTMDTGSDITWVACRPCDPCFVRQSLLFTAHRSSSYERESCLSENCRLMQGSCDDDQLCIFQLRYTDGSAIWGNIGTETIVFDGDIDEEISFPDIVFACVHGQSAPLAGLIDQPGIIGLGQGPASIVNQIGEEIDSKFAYCLPTMASQSQGWIKFGTHADEYHGSDEIQVVSMGQYGTQGNYYTVQLEDISVGEERLNIRWRPARVPSRDARTLIVDSGTEFIHLTPHAYNRVVTAVEEFIEDESFTDSGRLCYNVYNSDPYDGFPELTLHFHGADWTLPPRNAFRFVAGTQGEGLSCLAILPDPDGGVGMLGSLAQQNMYLKFDLGEGLLSFAAMDCDDDDD